MLTLLPPDDREVTLTFEQPQRVPPPTFLPQNPPRQSSTSMHSRTRSWLMNERSQSGDWIHSRPSRSSSISTLMRPWTSQSRRPIIGAPTNFRRVTEPVPPMPTRRRSFRPLELSMYLPERSVSPLPDFRLGGDWEEKLEQLQRPQAAVVRRETLDNSELEEYKTPRKSLSLGMSLNQYRREVLSEPFMLTVEHGPGPTLDSTLEMNPRISDLPRIESNRTPTLIPAQIEEMAASARPWSARSSMRSPSPFSLRSRSNTDLLMPIRKPSLRRSKTDTVDDAIRELNTIVEEKRVKALTVARNDMDSIPTSPTTHVPAIAPRMQVRARSETLSSIGSAFTVAVPKPLPVPPIPNFATSPYPPPGGHIHGRVPLTVTTSPYISTSCVATAVANNQSQPGVARITAKSRLSTWFRKSIPGSPISPNAPPVVANAQAQPFYQLTPSTTPSGTANRTQRSTSISTFSSVFSLDSSTSASFSDATYATPTTTIASVTTPVDDMGIALPRPSISKTPKTLRRMGPLKRGLSIDTTLSNGSAMTNVPPAYQFEDPHPVSPLESPVPLGRVGMAY
ncbi:hypothetical protein EJ08DRAFT_294030 [Tothia fuscella]|uniref:Uncharacterized protein n=1 Tax=Tothia fuscella TaxID=1048955 RepID=A0A9P4P2U4_9PEZI|nr:hypothetical protein EJ08DRAFT_294030 [Tothia fuscella]